MTRILNIDDKIILLYGLEGKRLEIVKEKALKYNYRVILINDRGLNSKVEDLIYEKNNYDNSDLEHIDIEFLLFVNIVNDDLYNFIDDLKSEQLYFPNKAILTKTNKNWTLSRLLRENKEEHIIMNMFTNLRRSVRKAEILIEKGIKDDEILDLLEKSKHYLNPREFDFDEMKNIHNLMAIKVNELSKLEK